MDQKSPEEVYTEVYSHYQAWTNDINIRLTRKDGWNDVTNAYYGILPTDWPFASKTTDPRIRTALVEKNARLANGKLKGRLVPREGADILKARINNALIEFQWDTANDGGSMVTKIGVCDMDTRLYNSKFALVKWRYETNADGETVFCGNDMTPLDIRDCGMDFACTHVRGAIWFQHRTWEYLDDLEKQNDTEGKPLFSYLAEIKAEIKDHPNQFPTQRRNEYQSRVKQIRGLEDRLGTDMAFPMIEVVTEYRKDRWITFCPQFSKVIRDIDNPYEHGQIPVAQLRYYPIQDDPLGENEVESVIPLWKAIQATLCGFMDEYVLKIRPPLKIIEGAARIETIQYGPEAQWLVNRPDAVTEMQSNGEAVRYFQASYSALVSAFNTAMGMMSQGSSGVDAFNPQKTATEIRASTSQQNARDQKNQQDLTEFIKDIIMMWVANNKQFLLQNKDKQQFVLRILGSDNFDYFKRMGLDQTYLPDTSMQTIADIIQQHAGMDDGAIQSMVQAGQMPKFPIVDNPTEKNPDKLKIHPKMEVNDMGDSAKLYIVPEDLDAYFDFVPDVRSMAVGSDVEMVQARQEAMEYVTSNPNVIQSLQADGYRVKTKDLLVSNFEDKGLKDAERYFEKLPQNGPQNPNSTGSGPLPGVDPNSPVQGLPNVPQTPVGGVPGQQMAGPIPAGLGGQTAVPNSGVLPQGLQ